MSILSEFFSETPIDSLRERCLLADGIDILGVYCLHTGKKIGTFESEELEFAINDESSEDEDAIIDALLVRVIASMRPSPALNKPDRLTIQNLASKRPVDAVAYLANRLHGNRDLLVKRTEALGPLVARIALHRQWADLYANGVDLTPWVHWLLEIDAKMNLHDMYGPLVSVGPFKKNLLDTVTVENHAEMLKTFESWVFSKLGEFDDRDKQMMTQAAWMRGNTFSKGAFVQSWLTNPEIANRKRADELKRAESKKNKVGRPKSERTQKLDARVASFLSTLDDILDSKSATEDSPVPARKPVVFTGGMLKFAVKKES